MGCLDHETVLAFVQRSLRASAHTEVLLHINGCPACRRSVANVATAFFEERGSPQDPESSMARTDGADAEFFVPGTKVSRYEIVDLIGVGAAGNVYRAHDPQLDRNVALKAIALDRTSHDGQATNADEARAMARLSHPNVVGVHDAGIMQGQIFVVMELVEGDTLSSWLMEEPRPWRQVLTLFMEAGRGLAAAHAVNVVHGDFKPENILVGADGRARVTDFGLATMATGGRAPDKTTSPLHISGTPAYMAPEQFQGDGATKAADQFSYCVALYRALYEQHPFLPRHAAGGNVRDFMDAIAVGKVAPPPTGSAAPTWLFGILAKGLAHLPNQRFSSMDALLAEIERGLARETEEVQRRKWILRAVLPVAIACGAAGIVWWGGAARKSDSSVAAPPPVCGNGKVEPGEVCDDGNRSNNDGCLSSCRFATCGDGELRRGVEECDDGNRINDDGCSIQCVRCDRGNQPSLVSKEGYCYWRSDTRLTWARALETCKQAGASLMEPHDFDSTIDIATRLLVNTNEPFWLGFSGSEHGEILSVNHTAMAANVAGALGPDAWTSNDCATQHSPAAWARAPCSREFGFLCGQSPWTSAIDPRTNHAFRSLFHEMTWDGARALCERSGAHLATFADTDTLVFLQKIYPGTFWMGARRTKKEVGFAWITNRPVTPSVFAHGEPNVPEDRSCMVMHDFAIVDRYCDGRQVGPYGVLCEID